MTRSASWRRLARVKPWQLIGMGIDYSIKVAALGIVPEGRRPSSANAWLLLILLVPFIGLPLFLLMGSPYINRRRHRIQQEASAMIDDVQAHTPNAPEDVTLPREVASITRLNRELTGFPAVWGHNLGVHTDYDDAIARVADVIDTATHTVNAEIYIMAWDETTDVFFQSLARAVDRGVTVRLLFDQIGSLKYPGFKDLGARLDDIGVDWHYMLPLAPWRGRFRRPDLRNHRKMIIVDNDVAFLGSINMIDRSYLMRANRRAGRQWIDYLVELTGPIVASIENVFAVDWYTESGEALDIPAQHDVGGRPGDENLLQLIPSGPGYTTEPNLRMFTSIIHHATTRLIICSPYFIPDESVLEAVTTAAYRGVQVDLLVSEQADQFLVEHAQSSYYHTLLEAGIRIHEFPEPYVLHSKFLIADPAGDGTTGHPLATFGSSNLDMRSFGLNYEATVLVAQGNLIAQFTELAENYMAVSHHLTAAKWERRSWARRYVDNVAKLSSALQ
ncbi:phospholipase D-like domain-containing protein [Corynebacterium uterequi]|uniref:Phosphatidylserine/phosphatidylglycerophosphate/ cardiolipin synthase n=1 Tax=Corynebacterium uterequi TaxID=1072256 RepID=A0A0G3HIY6_9CORY|nr:phospholipase D-like domain-containing protein [Corynebacterium uterequi]AKK11908.1 phosphatidylserine/phosphatidylglycerophosphate/cardiolipin synthase [Corynebacterium uterequi]